MDKEKEELQQRIIQLEKSFELQNLFLPPKPDPKLDVYEWYAIFGDYRNTTEGIITKIPWGGGSNMTAVYKVKRIG